MYKTKLLISAILMVTLTTCKAKQSASTDVMMQMKMVSPENYMNVDGLRMRYKIEGKAGKPALILIHGFTSSLESWNGLSAALKNEYQIVRYDLAGHGLTGPDTLKRYNHDARVSALRGLIHQLGLEKPILIGNSMGGNIAWRYAAAYPNEIHKLVLIDASGFPLNGLSDTPLELSSTLEHYFLKPTKFAINFGLNNQYFDKAKIPTGRADTILKMMEQAGNGEAFSEIFKSFTLPDPPQELAKITVPTMVIWGAEDAVIPSSHAASFAKAISNADVNIIENSGHVPHEEHPLKTAEIITTFLTQQ